MEKEQMNPQKAICMTCLSTDRNLRSIKVMSNVYQILKLVIQIEHDKMCTSELLLCWECLALLKRFDKFRQRAYIAQQHLHCVKVEDPLTVPTSLSTLARSNIRLSNYTKSQPMKPNEPTPIIKQERIDINEVRPIGKQLKQEDKKEGEQNLQNYIHINIPAKSENSSLVPIANQFSKKPVYKVSP